MIGFVKKIKAYLKEQQEQRDYENALAVLHSPDLFTPEQRDELMLLFPKAWTHMDNFSQDEIFKIAVTMTLFGFGCDNPAKMKTVMDVLAVQKIYRQNTGNPMIIKRG